MIGPLHYHDSESSQSGASLGTKYCQDTTGRVWKYAENGATQADPGKLMVQADIVANHINLSFSSAPAVGDRTVSVTLGATSAAADLYKDGFLVVQDGDGEGIAYAIEGHAAIGSAGTGEFNLGLGESIQVAGATSETNVDLVKNTYKDVVISATDQADVPLGVFNVTVAADAFGMLQTWGPASVWQDEATGVGDMLTTGTGVAGQVETEDGAGEPTVGYQGPTAGVIGEYQLVYLRLDN